jgi:hypothetical protein
VPAGVVVLDGGRISYAGPAAGAPDTPGALACQAVTVMPGAVGLPRALVHLVTLGMTPLHAIEAAR